MNIRSSTQDTLINDGPENELRKAECMNKLNGAMNFGSGNGQINKASGSSICLTPRCSGAAAVDLSSFIGWRRPTERER